MPTLSEKNSRRVPARVLLRTTMGTIMSVTTTNHGANDAATVHGNDNACGGDGF